MEFTFELRYDRKALTVMARTLRVILHKERDQKSTLFGCGLAAVTALILLFSGKTGAIQIIGWIVVALLCLYLAFQDQVNGTLALWKLPKKLRQGQWLFREDGYCSSTEAEKNEHSYEDIFAITESGNYICLVFFEGRAHVIDLSTIGGDTADDFRRLLRRRTSLTIQTL